MKQVEKLLFALIKYSICKDTQAPVITSGQELSEVCQLAAHHDMLHLVSDALLRLGITQKSPQLTEALEKERLKAIYRTEKLEDELATLCALFEEEKIEYIPLKGAVIRRLYPEGWMRTSSDIDFLVREEDIKRAIELIQERLSYRFHLKTDHDFEFFSPSGVHFELHFLLCEGDPAIDGVLNRVWEYASGGYKKEITPQMFLFYHLAHMAKHAKSRGCGIRPFVDLWILENSEMLNGDDTRGLVENNRLNLFYKAARQLAFTWLEGKECDQTAEVLGEYILNGGVYGNVENMMTVKQVKNGGRLGYALSRIFLSYDNLKMFYPALQKHKWLTPFCQLMRWFRLIFTKGGVKRSLDELKTSAAISDDRVKSIDSLFTALGLKN